MLTTEHAYGSVCVLTLLMTGGGGGGGPSFNVKLWTP